MEKRETNGWWWCLAFRSGPEFDDIRNMFLQFVHFARISGGSARCRRLSFQRVVEEIFFVFFSNQSPIGIDHAGDFHSFSSVEQRSTFDDASEKFTLSIRRCARHGGVEVITGRLSVKTTYDTAAQEKSWRGPKGRSSTPILILCRPTPKFLNFEQSSGSISVEQPDLPDELNT